MSMRAAAWGPGLVSMRAAAWSPGAGERGEHEKGTLGPALVGSNIERLGPSTIGAPPAAMLV